MKYAWYWLGIFVLCACQQAPTPSGMPVSEILSGTADSGYARAMQPRTFVFPQDHYAHPAYRNEWWYLTGNVETDAGRHFGYQVTLFRIALSPAAPASVTPVSESAWAGNQVWMAHVALTDVENNTHWHAQRLSRAALGLAGQTGQPFQVWLEDWRISGGREAEFPWHIAIVTEQFSLDLSVSPSKPVVLQGEQGLSRKSAAPGNASYYYSLTRLTTAGTIHVNGAEQAVAGHSWLDREWSTSALAETQVGWDWFALQFRDNQELMFYRLRLRDGDTDPHSAGTWVAADGATRRLSAEAVSLTPLAYWESGQGRRYPVQWQLSIPELDAVFQVTALVEDQELDNGFHYWEGAVKITRRGSEDVLGYGYLEMTGYGGG